MSLPETIFFQEVSYYTNYIWLQLIIQYAGVLKPYDNSYLSRKNEDAKIYAWPWN